MKRLALAGVLAAAFSLFAAEPAAPGAPAVPASPKERHYKTIMTGGDTPAITSEIWIKNGRVLTNVETKMGPTTFLKKDGWLYVTVAQQAMKRPVDPRSGAGPRGEESQMSRESLGKTGRMIGTERIDGEVCEKWVVTQTSGDRTSDSTIWFSPSLEMPRQVSFKTEKGDYLIQYVDIETKVSLPDSAFEPDPKLVYTDLSALPRGAPPPGQ